jgi:hypothetical protein
LNLARLGLSTGNPSVRSAFEWSRWTSSWFFAPDRQLFDWIEDYKATYYIQVLDKIEKVATSQAAYEGSPLRVLRCCSGLGGPFARSSLRSRSERRLLCRSPKGEGGLVAASYGSASQLTAAPRKMPGVARRAEPGYTFKPTAISGILFDSKTT